jgi:hypothetical protein
LSLADREPLPFTAIGGKKTRPKEPRARIKKGPGGPSGKMGGDGRLGRSRRGKQTIPSGDCTVNSHFPEMVPSRWLPGHPATWEPQPATTGATPRVGKSHLGVSSPCAVALTHSSGSQPLEAAPDGMSCKGLNVYGTLPPAGCLRTEKKRSVVPRSLLQVGCENAMKRKKARPQESGPVQKRPGSGIGPGR